MTLGVTLVSYDTGSALPDCIENLLALARAPGTPGLRVLVLDNASLGGTVARFEG